MLDGKEKKQTLTPRVLFNACLDTLMFCGAIWLLITMFNTAPVVCTQIVCTYTLANDGTAKKTAPHRYCISRSNDPDKDIDWLTSCMKIELHDILLVLVNNSVPVRNNIKVLNVMYNNRTKEVEDMHENPEFGLMPCNTVLVIAGPHSMQIFTQIISALKVNADYFDAFLVTTYSLVYAVLWPLFVITPDSWCSVALFATYLILRIKLG